MGDALKDILRELVVFLLFFLPRRRRISIDRWLRGREELRKVQRADYILMSWGKSGRTWLRLMLSRFYQVRFGLSEKNFLQFDNLKRLDPQIPSVLFTHGNYLRNYTNNWDTKVEFHGKKIILLVRDPRDVAVSQYFQWKYRMRPWKKLLNDYPPHGADIPIFEFVMTPSVGLPRVIRFFNEWAAEITNARAALVIRYEDMRGNPHKTLGDALEFLGTPGSGDEIEQAVTYASFENMKRLEERKVFWRSGRRLVPGNSADPNTYKVRRAKIGGYRDYFSDEELARIDHITRSSLSPFYGYDAGAADDAVGA